MRSEEVAVRVLLVVDHIDSLFQSGIAQQVYFTRQSLLAASVQVDVASLSAPVAAYREVGIETWTLRADTRLDGFAAVLFVSTNLKPDAGASRAFLEGARRDGVPLALMLCGNYYHLLQEQFLFQRHGERHLRDGLYNPWLREFWALETYDAHRPFMQALLGRPVRTLPYCWAPDIIERFCAARQLQPTPAPAPAAAGLRVLIAEPNVSVHKSALLPLLIADGLQQRLQSAGAQGLRVLALGARGVDHALLAPFLGIYQQGRVEAYPRMNLMEVLDQLHRKGHAVLFIAHHMSNGLNFAHLEALSLGHAVVHNSEQLAATGFFYPDEAVDAGVAAAWRALTETPAALATRRAAEHSALAHHAPAAPRVVNGYRQALRALCAARAAAPVS